MNNKIGKQVWLAPKLEQIAMVDTAGKANAANEGIQPDGSMIMAVGGMQS
jgi:hypothetical protein